MYKSAKALREEIAQIYADADGRALTASERGKLEGLLDIYEDTKRVEDRAAELFGGTGEVFTGVADSRANFGGGTTQAPSSSSPLATRRLSPPTYEDRPGVRSRRGRRSVLEVEGHPA
jgi:hypothetical protein